MLGLNVSSDPNSFIMPIISLALVKVHGSLAAKIVVFQFIFVSLRSSVAWSRSER